MTAAPAEPPRTPSYDADALPKIPRATAAESGLVGVKELAIYFGCAASTVRHYLAKDGAPAVLAVAVEFRFGKHEPFWDRRAVNDWLIDCGAGGRVRSAPPRRVGTRTPTANRPYQWRDPARWNGFDLPSDS